nr:MAG TPA: hypothetical protein [Caudoviricetes sp.]
MLRTNRRASHSVLQTLSSMCQRLRSVQSLRLQASSRSTTIPVLITSRR